MLTCQKFRKLAGQGTSKSQFGHHGHTNHGGPPDVAKHWWRHLIINRVFEPWPVNLKESKGGRSWAEQRLSESSGGPHQEGPLNSSSNQKRFSD